MWCSPLVCASGVVSGLYIEGSGVCGRMLTTVKRSMLVGAGTAVVACASSTPAPMVSVGLLVGCACGARARTRPWFCLSAHSWRTAPSSGSRRSNWTCLVGGAEKAPPSKRLWMPSSDGFCRSVLSSRVLHTWQVLVLRGVLVRSSACCACVRVFVLLAPGSGDGDAATPAF